MAYQNINQYVFKKWYLKPVYTSFDMSLASDERDYNEEVVFSNEVIGFYDGNISFVANSVAARVVRSCRAI